MIASASGIGANPVNPAQGSSGPEETGGNIGLSRLDGDANGDAKSTQGRHTRHAWQLLKSLPHQSGGVFESALSIGDDRHEDAARRHTFHVTELLANRHRFFVMGHRGGVVSVDVRRETEEMDGPGFKPG
jgi:hypothetical protein